MSLIAASVSGSLCPFLACLSHVCLGGGVPGAVEGVAVDRGLVLGLVDEDEEEVEDLGLSALLGASRLCAPTLLGSTLWLPLLRFS